MALPSYRHNLYDEKQFPVNVAENPVINALTDIVNYGLAGEGITLPPKQIGEFRVPFISGLKVLESFVTSGKIVLGWIDRTEVDTPVAYYNIYKQEIFDTDVTKNDVEPVFLSSARHSPCTIKLPTLPEPDTIIILYVQPVLINGLLVPITLCPTTTVVVP